MDCGVFFFFNDTATTEIYTLSLHDALPISDERGVRGMDVDERRTESGIEVKPLYRPEDLGEHFDYAEKLGDPGDRKSTRLNSSHANISYAVFCLKKKTRSRCRSLRRRGGTN